MVTYKHFRQFAREHGVKAGIPMYSAFDNIVKKLLLEACKAAKKDGDILKKKHLEHIVDEV